MTSLDNRGAYNGIAYLRSVPSDSSRQDSSLASKPQNVVSLVSGEKETQKPQRSAYIKLSLEKKRK